MVIGIDGNEANVAQKVGVSIYAEQLLRYFQKQANPKLGFIIYLRQKPLSHMPTENTFYKYRVIPGSFLWSQLFLPLDLFFRRKIDIFFTPAHYAPRFLPVPLVVTIHDLSYFYFPDEFLRNDLYKLINWTAYSVRKASQIIAVSKTTKKDLAEFYHLNDDRVRVIYNGFDKPINPPEQSPVLKSYHLQKEAYVLFVGTLQPRKNLTTLIDAFSRFYALYPHFKLVLTGKKGWLYDKIFFEIQHKGLEDHVVITGYLPNSEVAILYRDAFCFVFPSLYEGFGIPLLEAMSYGCPVISSHSASLPEVGGDACLYFDPKDSQDLLEDLIRLKSESSLKTSLIKKGHERLKQFSWEKCAKETLEVLSNIPYDDKARS